VEEKNGEMEEGGMIERKKTPEQKAFRQGVFRRKISSSHHKDYEKEVMDKK